MSIIELSLKEATLAPPRVQTQTQTVTRPEFARGALIVKRALDIVLASVLLVVALPLFLVIALAVRMTSGRHVFFTQERVGINGKHFRMRKFRTMVHDAEARLVDLRQSNEADGLLFKIKDDPRVTALGSKLRPLGLDELPQLWNVLKGDMSLVGPRPALPCEVAKYDERLRDRLVVKPGITGLWQIKGRHELSFDDYARYDLFYVENWSLALDAKVIVGTLPALLRRRGSY
jgi:lipopolysaccharide/colanic/teichoic acid biosynthesis glycosyltransferase